MVEKEVRRRMGISLYLLALVFVMFLAVTHIFGLIEYKIDKFTYYIVSVAVALLVLPAVAYLKFFGIVHIKKDPGVLSVGESIKRKEK